MALNIETFSNIKGGNSLFKVLGHPLAAGKAPVFLERLRAAGRGAEVACKRVEIPLSGSLLWRYSEMFEPDARRRAGDDAYLIVRDQTCRLFGYHGLLNGEAAFSFDHMFGV